MGGKAIRALGRAVGQMLPLLAIAALIGTSALSATPGAQAVEPTPATQTEARASYVVRVGRPATLVVGAASIPELTTRASDQVKNDLAEQLASLASAGVASAATFDAVLDGFRVDLTDSARARLALSRLVGEITPASAAQPAADSQPMNHALPPRTSSTTRGAQAVGSVNFIQVNSPFMWGRTNVGGLSVEITLENSAGQVKGVAAQKYQSSPNDYVKIDRTQLYYETVFRDPNDPAHPTVTILPGDRVHVVTTGIDPSTGSNAVEDKRIVVDDLQTWTSFENDTVSGLAPPNASVTVTVGTSLWIADYVTPGNALTFADATADAAGRFSISQFRTSTSSTLRKVDLAQGSTGYVRVRHSDGNEIYTYHGQNVFVLQNSEIVHGYAFPLPTAPTSLDSNVAVQGRPRPSVGVTLKGSGGGVKESGEATNWNSYLPYRIFFKSAQVQAGDVVEVSVWGTPHRTVAVPLIDAVVDVAANQVTGSAPPNTALTVQAGRIAGYISSRSYFSFLVNKVTTDASGRFSSGAFGCGDTGSLKLAPGSFGYVGFEDARANFIYESIAAPTLHVMSDYPFAEGWLPNGAARPTLAVRDASGGDKHSSTVRPIPLWLISQRVYVNTYFNQITTQFVVPSDVVTLSGPAGTAIVPVDRINAYMNIDNETIFGDAPAGSTLKVIPENDRWAYRDTTAGSASRFAAPNPFKSVSSYDCSESDKTEDFAKTNSGRVYYQHADGNAVFAHYGRTMWVNQNEAAVELWPFVWRDLDWEGDGTPPKRPITVTLTPRDGSAPITMGGTSEYSHHGYALVTFVNAQNQRVIIRAGDSVTASFQEGPDLGPKRTATLTLNQQPQLLGIPDVDTSTVAGVGARGWHGGVTLYGNTPPYTSAIVGGTLTAWGPQKFLDRNNKVLPLSRGYSGFVGLYSPTGVRLWSAWAAVALPTKITGFLNVGDTKVCGTAAPNATLRIHDLSVENQDVILATGTVDGAGKFCATVPPLVQDQVILAEADGTYSQPVVVGSMKHTWIAFSPRGVTAQAAGLR